MVNRCSKLIWLFIVLVLIVIGCSQQRKQPPAVSPDITTPETDVVMPDYASAAVEATGGLQNWMKAEKLELNCVVTFYQQDGSFYLTEQHHEVYPALNFIRLSALEPQGNLVWELSRPTSKTGRSSHRGPSLPVELCGKYYFTELILDIITAPLRFLDKPVEFTKDPEPVRKQGRCYYSIERADPDNIGIWSEAVFYQSADSSLIDTIWFKDSDIQELLAVRGYNYRRLEENEIWIPRKIEIFRTDAAGIFQQRLVKIDYY